MLESGIMTIQSEKY